MIFSMNILFGIIFLLGGLALAVFLGVVLYRDPKREVRPRGNIFRTEKGHKAA
jgi:hypothetical protein